VQKREKEEKKKGDIRKPSQRENGPMSGAAHEFGFFRWGEKGKKRGRRRRVRREHSWRHATVFHSNPPLRPPEVEGGEEEKRGKGGKRGKRLSYLHSPDSKTGTKRGEKRKKKGDARAYYLKFFTFVLTTLPYIIAFPDPGRRKGEKRGGTSPHPFGTVFLAMEPKALDHFSSRHRREKRKERGKRSRLFT